MRLFRTATDHSRRGQLIAAANSDYVRAVIDRDSFRFAVGEPADSILTTVRIGISEAKTGREFSPGSFIPPGKAKEEVEIWKLNGIPCPRRSRTIFFKIINLNNKLDEILEIRETIKILQLLKIMYKSYNMWRSI